jgi:transcriptional regulator with XRE-family HTH domain
MERIRISSAQIRGARALLDWSARKLSQCSGVSQSTVHRAETAHSVPNVHAPSLLAIKAALEDAGIEFLDDSGVRLRSANGKSPEMNHIDHRALCSK